jgi:MFS family permease
MMGSIKHWLRPRELPTKYIFAVFVYINLWNFIDRGIIPGSSVEFDNFIKDTTHTSSPDALLGFLQSSFIVGFVIGSVIFSNLVHHYGNFFVIRTGVTVWLIAVVLCGLARFINNYYFLLFARMLSGVGEASIQCTMPPWIQSNAPNEQRGTWLSIYYTGLPVGTAIGYTYSSFLSNSIGWEFAFFGEALFMSPAYLMLFVIAAPPSPAELAKQAAAEENNGKTIANAILDDDEGAFIGEENNRQRNKKSSSLEYTENSHMSANSFAASTSSSSPKKPPTIWEEIVILTKSSVYDAIILGNAAQTAVIIGLSTFGSAFFMSFGFYDTESEASTMFGVLISLAGIFGVPLGGWYIDFFSKRRGLLPDKNENDSTKDNSGKAENGGVVAEEMDDQERLLNNLDDKSKHTILDIILGQLVWASIVAIFLLSILYIVYNKGLYLFLIVCGCFMLFFTFTGIYMAVMVAIPVENRPFGMAFCAIVSHVIGDVPSPIFVGWLKDYLAPDCVANDDDDNVAASDACRDESHGLRVTFLLIILWLFWTNLFFILAWWLNRRRMTADAEVKKPILENAN